MISTEKINSNFVIWTERLRKYNCYSDRLVDELGDKIKNASFSLNENSGSAYQGSMLDTVLNTLCRIGYEINENAFGYNEKQKIRHEHLYINVNMLMRVLLLQHIAKAEMFVLQESSWKAKNGMLFDFSNDLKTQLKLGERSIFLCMKYGIELSEEEYEAMRIIDKDEDKTNSFISPLCEIVKIANQLTAIEKHREYMSYKIKETLEK